MICRTYGYQVAKAYVLLLWSSHTVVRKLSFLQSDLDPNYAIAKKPVIVQLTYFTEETETTFHWCLLFKITKTHGNLYGTSRCRSLKPHILLITTILPILPSFYIMTFG